MRAIILAALLACPALASADGGLPLDGGLPDAEVQMSVPGKPEPSPPQTPQQAIEAGAKSAVAADCARCVGGAVPFFKSKNGAYAILGISIGGLVQAAATLLPYLLPPPQALDQAKP